MSLCSSNGVETRAVGRTERKRYILEGVESTEFANELDMGM